MTSYQISNKTTGVVLGIYDGNSKSEAHEAMARDAGYPSLAAMCDVLGLDLDAAGDDLTFREVSDVVTVRAAVDVDAIIAAGEDARIEVWSGCEERVREVLAENAERTRGNRFEMVNEDGDNYNIEIVLVFGA